MMVYRREVRGPTFTMLGKAVIGALAFFIALILASALVGCGHDCFVLEENCVVVNLVDAGTCGDGPCVDGKKP